MNPLSPATRYFLEYWADLWSGVSSKRDLLTSFNPRVVVKELLDEIVVNKQRNKSNEDFFRRILSAYHKSDPASQKRLKLHLQMILKEFEFFNSRPAYLPKLCIAALKDFEEFIYFEDCLASILELTIQQSFSTSDKEAVRQIVNHLIVEFREVGYADDEIRDIPRNIFSSIQYNPDGTIFWDFPHSIVCDDWRDEIKFQEYRRKLEELQTRLTEQDRFEALRSLVKKTKRHIRYIFRVNGMVEIQELEVSQVLFYSPLAKRFVKQDSEINMVKSGELFGEKEENTKAVNAMVVVEAISTSSGEMAARSKVEKAFALCRRVMTGASPLWVSKSYIALNDKNEYISSSHSAFERPADDWTRAITIRPDQWTDAVRSLSVIENARRVAFSNGWGRRFDEALAWLRKAEEGDSYVDRLLAYWICIETLCAKTDDDTSNWFELKKEQVESDIFLIKEIVGKMRAVGKCYEHGWMIYRQLWWQVNGPFRSQRDNVSIPAELLQRAQLSPKKGGEMWLGDFVNCCAEIERLWPDSLFKDQIGELRSFYKDKTTALNVLRGHLRITQDELAFIYRMRNKIAHDGNSEHPLAMSLCKLAGEYAVSFFNQIVRYIEEKNEGDLDAILIMAVQDYDRIEMRLQKEDPMDVFLERK